MKSPRHTASDPATSVWVSANAGSGKTKVLTDRVLRLLLQGAHPSKILCLTYTNAATAEMKNRIYKQLSDWVAYDDTRLKESLLDLTGNAPDPEVMNLARALFATVIESPEGVRIQTIHALCQSLLRRFPVESGVPPHFRVLDEEASKALIDEARRQMLTSGLSDQTDLAKTLQRFAHKMNEFTFSEMLKQIVKSRRKLQMILQPEKGIERTIQIMREAVLEKYALDRELTLDTWIDEIAHYAPDNLNTIKDSISALQEGLKTDIKIAHALLDWWGVAADERKGRIDAYSHIFLTDEMEPRKSLITGAFKKKFPALEDALRAEQQRLYHQMQILKSLGVIDYTQQVMVIADAILGSYQAIKERTSSLDFEDQILLTMQLLYREKIAPWILYKLDGGLDHILIDEAQDTSPVQWKLIAKLVEEFFSGEGASKRDRTVFVVGDEKQSIFSFQGAEPRAFEETQSWFNRKLKAAEKPYIRVPLSVSYRSTESVLKAVDAVFSNPSIRKGVAMMENTVTHEAFRTGEAGRVECWDLIEADDVEERTAWKVQDLASNMLRPETKLARQIAETIRSWLDEGRILETKNRKVKPGDIMILVRSRSRIVNQLLRALRREDIPVAGSDRLIITDDIAVMDMMALFRFLLLPQDDMSLAIVLKSPLIGLSDEQLFELAYDRGSQSLWERVREYQNKSNDFLQAFAWLSLALSKTDRTPPFELISLVLESWNGKKRFIGRLGEEVQDPLDELLALALRFERENAPSLQAFLHWMESRDTLVKRDMEQGKDEVSILTVHGAKGLQAPIVFLPDTTRAQRNDLMPLLWNENEDWFVWAPSKDEEDTTCYNLRNQQKVKQEEENRRLMYVAMTRAEDELYVCGYSSKHMPEQCWYNLIKSGLSQVAVPSEKSVRDKKWNMLLFENPQTKKLKNMETVHIPIKETQPLPEYFSKEPPPEPILPKPLSPSQLGGNESNLLSPSQDAQRILRGTLIHKLLQYVPDIAPVNREAKIAAYLEMHSPDTELRSTILKEILSLLEHRIMQPFLTPGGICEAPISGIVKHQDGTPVVVSGQIDRLVVGDKDVWVLDYKTGRKVPKSIADIPDAYIVQMQLYRDLLRQIYPNKAVRSALLWTAGPSLFELDDRVMDAIQALDARVV
jgi:ATP-dependent helicase/nuclease subunit A